jgi:hypothetical protein
VPTPPTRDPDRGAAQPVLVAAVVAVLVLCAFQLWWALDLRASVRRLETAALRLDEARAAPSGTDSERLRAMEHMLQAVHADLDVHYGDTDALRRMVGELTRAVEEQSGLDVGGVRQPPQLDWTEPELFEAARRAAAEVGIELTEDEVRVPARIVLRQGLLEYLAVLKGGKEHETLVSLHGNTPPDERRPKTLGVRLNNAIQALGFTRGHPIRFTPTGTLPARGEPVYLFLEWEEAGERVVVRAEDLVWDRLRNAPMERGKWVYVGSSFVPGDEEGELLFAADLTAEAVATYSAPNTIIDNVADGAQDDTVFLVATPRLPEGVHEVTFVVRREDREPTREFPPPPVPGQGSEGNGSAGSRGPDDRGTGHEDDADEDDVDGDDDDDGAR